MLKPPVAAAELVAVDPSADHRATLFREQLDRSLSLLERGRGLGGLSALAVGGMGWGQVPLGVLVPVVLANVLVSECAVSLDGMRRQSVVRDDRAWYHALILMMGAAGLTWGLQMGVMIAMAPSATAKMAAVAFGVGLVGANIVFGSPFRVPFWVMQAGLLLPTIVVELSSPDPALRWMGGAAILNMAFSYVLHDHVHRSLVESIDANLRLAHQAHHDPLTGLPNRAALTGALAQAMEEGARVGVLYIDLDRFKVVNDALGHDVGDQLLSAVAARLRGEVGLEGQLFRVGGDELIALLRHPASDAEVTGLATRIHAALREPVAVAGRELPVTASIGLAIGRRRERAGGTSCATRTPPCTGRRTLAETASRSSTTACGRSSGGASTMSRPSGARWTVARSSRGTSRSSICGRARSWAPRPSRAGAIRTAGCSPPGRSSPSSRRADWRTTSPT